MKNIQKALVLTLLLSVSHCIKATTSAHLTDQLATYTQQIDKCINDIDNYFIDEMIEKQKNQASPFDDITSKDVAMAILSFVPTQDLVACSHTSQKFYTLVNQFDRRHDLIKASHKVAELLKRYKDDPDVKQREPVRETIDRLVKNLPEITEPHSVHFIAHHPTARHYFIHEFSFFKRLLGLYKKQINRLAI